jgi:phospholipid/cholesterol/gamma-HCH transport system permease protein
LASATPGGQVVVDLSTVPTLSGLEAATLLRLIAEGQERKIEVRLKGLAPAARQAFTGLGLEILGKNAGPAGPESLPFVEKVGERAIGRVEAAKRVLSIIGELTHWMLVAPWTRNKGIKWDRVFEQIVKIGIDGVPIVAFLSFLIGAVLALNGASQLRQFGAAIYIADLVGVSMTREMAPLITAIIVGGRSGSAITAELGTMVVSEELDAMRTMALAPGRFLLVPRVLALLCAMPCLTLIADMAGIFGGYWVGVVLLQMGSSNYVDETGQALLVSDLVVGLVKSVVFAYLIGVTACYRGFNVRGGAEQVGTSTTSSVVTSIVLCILANAIFTTLFYYVKS